MDDLMWTFDEEVEAMKSEKGPGQPAGQPPSERVLASVRDELQWFYATPPPLISGLGAPLVAQSYDPRAGGSYDPTTDVRLAKLVLGRRRTEGDEWMRIKRVLDRVGERVEGCLHDEVLRRAFGPSSLDEDDFRWPGVAEITRTALARGESLARDAAYHHAIETAYLAARQRGCSGPTVAMRVLETDALYARAPARISLDDALTHARAALRSALAGSRRGLPSDTEFIDAVKLEMTELVYAAVEQYRITRSELGATRRQERARRKRENEELLDRELGRKRRKESERFEQRLARARARARRAS